MGGECKVLTGPVIRLIRTAKGVKLEDLGARAGVTAAWLSIIERRGDECTLTERTQSKVLSASKDLGVSDGDIERFTTASRGIRK